MSEIDTLYLRSRYKNAKSRSFFNKSVTLFSVVDKSNCASRKDVDVNLAILSLQLSQMPKKSPKVSC